MSKTSRWPARSSERQVAAIPAQTLPMFSLQTGNRIAVFTLGRMKVSFSATRVISIRSKRRASVTKPSMAVQNPMEIQARSSTKTKIRIISSAVEPFWGRMVEKMGPAIIAGPRTSIARMMRRISAMRHHGSLKNSCSVRGVRNRESGSAEVPLKPSFFFSRCSRRETAVHQGRRSISSGVMWPRTMAGSAAGTGSNGSLSSRARSMRIASAPGELSGDGGVFCSSCMTLEAISRRRDSESGSSCR